MIKEYLFRVKEKKKTGKCTNCDPWAKCSKCNCEFITEQLRNILPLSSQVSSELPTIHGWIHLLSPAGKCRWVVGTGDWGILSKAFWARRFWFNDRFLWVKEKNPETKWKKKTYFFSSILLQFSWSRTWEWTKDINKVQKKSKKK